MAQDPKQDKTASTDESKKNDKLEAPHHEWDKETEEEKKSVLREYDDIKPLLDEIRSLHCDSKLYIANTKKNDLLTYINSKYKDDEKTKTKLIDGFNSHPRLININKEMEEMTAMLNFMTGDGKTPIKNNDKTKTKTNDIKLDGWQLLSETETWKSEYMETNEFNTPTQSYRVTAIGNVSLFYIVPIIYEMDLMSSWMPLAKESFQFHQSSLYCKSGMVRIGLTWPIADRECVLFGYGVDDLENGKMLVYFDSREENKNGEKLDGNIIPQCSKDRVRVDIYIGGFYFEKISENLTKITCVWNADPKISVPYAVLNWFSGHFVNLLLSRIINAAKKCQNEPNKSPYTKRIKENPYFYQRMKDNMAKAKSTSQMTLKNTKNTKNNNNDKNEIENKENDK